ncbi:MAG TPA: tetratricopeptide repeat protein [Myxococcota bacterium]|jgi:tetratricopeptide (TPR) repeat protein/uncharacterized protein (AIM24 family)|nr:tetratricopeptide repeat protein [Myxococcota bacterium]
MAAYLETPGASGEQFLVDLNRGTLLLQQGKVDEAREVLERARARRPEDPQALNQLGLAYFRLGWFGQAREIFGALLERFPHEASLHLNLGLAWLRLGDARAALRELEAALAIDPMHRRANAYAGLAYARLGDHPNAAGAFLRAGLDHLALKMEDREFGPKPGVIPRGGRFADIESEILGGADGAGAGAGADVGARAGARAAKGAGAAAVAGTGPGTGTDVTETVEGGPDPDSLQMAIESSLEEPEIVSLALLEPAPVAAESVAAAVPVTAESVAAAAAAAAESAAAASELEAAFASIDLNGAAPEIFAESEEPGAAPHAGASNAPPHAGAYTAVPTVADDGLASEARGAGARLTPPDVAPSEGVRAEDVRAEEERAEAAAALTPSEDGVSVTEAFAAGGVVAPAGADVAPGARHAPVFSAAAPGTVAAPVPDVDLSDDGPALSEATAAPRAAELPAAALVWASAPAVSVPAPPAMHPAAVTLAGAALVAAAREGLPAWAPGTAALAAVPGAATIVSLRVAHRAFARASFVIAAEGPLTYTPLPRRQLGRPLEEIMGGGDPVCVVDGDGRLTLGGLGHVLIVVTLAGERAYLRESVVVAFDDRVVWDSGVLRGLGETPEPLLHVRGLGQVVLHLPAAPLAVPVRPGAPTRVRWHHVAGWLGKVVPAVVAAPLDAEGARTALEFTGEGAVLCHDLGPEGGLIH